MVVMSYTPPGSLGGKWPLVAPLVQVQVQDQDQGQVQTFVVFLAPVVLFWESSALFVFSPPTTAAVALPAETHRKLLAVLPNM